MGTVMPAPLREETLTTAHRLPCLICLHVSFHGRFCLAPPRLFNAIIIWLQLLISKLASSEHSVKVASLRERSCLDCVSCGGRSSVCAHSDKAILA